MTMTTPVFLSLPTEILFLIFSFVTIKDKESIEHTAKKLIPLSLCNRFLLNLAQPLIYETIAIKPKFSDVISQPILDRQTNALSKTILSNTFLGQHVKHLIVDFTTISDATPSWNWLGNFRKIPDSPSWVDLIKMAATLPNARKLKFFQGESNGSSILGSTYFSQCVQNMKLLEVVGIFGLLSEEVVPSLYLLQSLSKLKSLSLSIIYSYMGSRVYSPDLLLPETYGTNQLLDLRIYTLFHRELSSQRKGKPSILRDAFSWCKRPGVLSLENLNQIFFLPNLSVQSVLSAFTTTEILTKLTLDCVANEPRGIPTAQQLQVSKLPSLRKLTLIHWLPGSNDSSFDVFESFLSGTVRDLEFQYDEARHVEFSQHYLVDGGLKEMTTIMQAVEHASTSLLQKFTLEIQFSVKTRDHRGFPFVRNLKPAVEALDELKLGLEIRGIVAKCVGRMEIPKLIPTIYNFLEGDKNRVVQTWAD
jgi:hypothetical protein